MNRLTLCFFLMIGLTANAQIKFEDLSWTEAVSQAKKQKKIIFLDAYTTWCEPCKLLEKYTFSDLEVANYFNDNFINIRLDMEDYPGIELAEDYLVDVYPTMLFINGEQEVVHRGCGAMEASEFLELGKTALTDSSLLSLKTKFDDGNQDSELLFKYLDLMGGACLDAAGFAQQLMSEISDEELKNQKSFSLIENYQWDIFSREFKYLSSNRKEFEEELGKERVNNKIFNTYLAQYQEVYDSEELHVFGLKALLNEIKQTSFIGSDTLLAMINLHYHEVIEDWQSFSEDATSWVGMTGTNDPDVLNDLAWKFYLFVNDRPKLELATGWAKQVVDMEPSPSAIDTYASLLFKQGERKKAIELEKQAIEMASELQEDTSHFEHQLGKFQAGSK